RVGITDRGTTPAVELGLADLKASVRDVRTDGKKPWPFDASFRVVQGGRFTARGRVAPDGRTADAMLKLTQLALTPAQPYMARSADVVLRSGEVSSTGKLTYRAGAESPSVTYTGSADVERLVVMEAAHAERAADDHDRPRAEPGVSGAHRSRAARQQLDELRRPEPRAALRDAHPYAQWRRRRARLRPERPRDGEARRTGRRVRVGQGR